MKNFYKDKKVLITGHSGFKGSWLAQVLLQWGADVSGVSLVPDTSPSLHSLLGHQQAYRSYYADVCDYETLAGIFKREKPEIVFHLAAQPLVRRGYREPRVTFASNIQGTVNLLEAVRSTDSVRSVVIVTTDKVYQDKNWLFPYREIDALGGYDPYSSSKAAADIVAQSYIQSYFNPTKFQTDHQTLVAIGRAGNVIGGGDWSEDRLVPDIMRATFEKKLPVVLRYPRAVRPWEHVLEPLSGYLLLAEKAYRGDVSVAQAWNFGPEPESFVTVENLARTMVTQLQQGTVIIDPDPSSHETMTLKLDTTKARSELGWRSQWSFAETVGRTAEWYVGYYRGDILRDITERQINSFFSHL